MCLHSVVLGTLTLFCSSVCRAEPPLAPRILIMAISTSLSISVNSLDPLLFKYITAIPDAAVIIMGIAMAIHT